MKTKKYTYIDSLRGYAVLLVFSHHIAGSVAPFANNKSLTDLFYQCRMGVMLFFIISSLTLFLSMHQKNKIEKSPIRNFFLRRFFRIAPLFYILILYNIIIQNFTLQNIISTITFTNGFIPDVMMNQVVKGGWTLAVEMIFYLLMPILFKYIKNVNGAFILFVSTFILSIIARYLMLQYLSPYYETSTLMAYSWYWLPAQLPIFSLGILMYYILFNGDQTTKEPQYTKFLSYFLLFSGIYFFATLTSARKLFINETIAFSFTFMLIIFGMAIYPKSIFNNKLVQFLGKISYSFYLIHIIIMFGYIKFSNKLSIPEGQTFIVGFVVVFSISALISYISYLLIEQPFQKLGSKIISNLEQRHVATVPYNNETI